MASIVRLKRFFHASYASVRLERSFTDGIPSLSRILLMDLYFPFIGLILIEFIARIAWLHAIWRPLSCFADRNGK